VAGPEPQDGHTVGQVFVGVARPGSGQRQVRELRLSGSRTEIRRQTADLALGLLAAALGMPVPVPGVEPAWKE
jgi:nicotinamide-nucleotide amidase